MDNALWPLHGKGISMSTFAGVSAAWNHRLIKQNTNKKRKQNRFQLLFGGEVCLGRVQDALFGCLCAFYGVQINLLWHPPLISRWSYLGGSTEEHPSWEGGLTVSCGQHFTLQLGKAPLEPWQPLPVLFLYIFPIMMQQLNNLMGFFSPISALCGSWAAYQQLLCCMRAGRAPYGNLFN